MTANLGNVGGREVLLPYPHRGRAAHYCAGCRCRGCQMAHAGDVRDRRRRQKEGIEGPFDRLPVDGPRAMLNELRERGLTWEQLRAACHVEVRDLRRITLGVSAHVTRKVFERIEAGYSDLMGLPDPAEYRAVKLDGGLARWMVGSLFARGWSLRQIAEESGTALTLMRAANGDKIKIETFQKIEPVFLKHHLEWGPNRRTARMAWRRGSFVSDCYDWERRTPDLRPIPGTFHPDLVMEAALYRGAIRGVQQHVLDNMASWGQWPSELCARAALRRWERDFGYEDSVGGSRICHDRGHSHHILPAVWR